MKGYQALSPVGAVFGYFVSKIQILINIPDADGILHASAIARHGA